jgi:predicted DNA-binding protein (MmcQ/YjbR family)
MDRRKLDRLCRAWPGVSGEVKWGADLVYSVAGKMFLVCPDAARPERFSFKVPEEHFLALTEQPGIIPSPEAARFKWVRVSEPGRYSDTWLAERIRDSYELVAAKLPKKTRVALGLA